MFLVSGCFGDPDRSTPTTGPQPSARCEISGQAPRLPPQLTATCRWQTKAEEIVGHGDIVVMTAEESPGRFVMTAVAAATGESLWRTDPVEAMLDDPRTGEPNDAARSLEIVHWQGRPYAAFTYTTRPSGDPTVDHSAPSAVTMVALSGGADPRPVTWNSPDELTRVRHEPMFSDDVVAIVSSGAEQHPACGASVRYGVIDPITGQTRPLEVAPCTGLMAVGDGWFARLTGSAPDRMGIYSYDGGLLWQVEDFAPDGVNPQGLHEVVAAYGDYVITRWIAASETRIDRGERLLAVHDRTGKVLATSKFGSFGEVPPDEPQPPERLTTLASPNEKWLVVHGGGATVAVDLNRGKATGLERGLAPVGVTNEGEIFARRGNGDAVVVDGATGEVTWRGAPETLLPTALINDIGVVSSKPPSTTAAGTHTTWAFGTGAGSRAELARRFAPMVWLADQDTNGPTSATDFIDDAQLWWAHDQDCQDDLIAEEVSAAGLARGEYSHRRAVNRNPVGLGVPVACPEHIGPTYYSDEDTHPARSEVVPDDEGFYLDLDDNHRRGIGPQAPVYWEYQRAENGNVDAYVYWLFYAYNDFVNNHEGDWERVAVRTEGDKPIGVTFWRHHEPPCLVPWDKLDMADGSHPVVYSAKGSHGSYPHEDTYRLSIPGGISVGDRLADHTSQGTRWETWNNAKPVTSEDWWGYGGAWGVFKQHKDLSGPDGPNPRYNKAVGAVDANLCATPDEFVGDWRSSKPVSGPARIASVVRLSLRGGDTGTNVGEIRHTDTMCSGTLELREATPNKVVLHETITADPQAWCDDQGTVTLALEHGVMTYSHQGMTGDAAPPEALERD